MYVPELAVCANILEKLRMLCALIRQLVYSLKKADFFPVESATLVCLCISVHYFPMRLQGQIRSDQVVTTTLTIASNVATSSLH